MKTSHGLVIDGFTRSPIGGSGKQKSYKITESSNLVKRGHFKSRLKSTAQSVHKRTQRSQTLMRGGVKRPTEAPGPQLTPAKAALKKKQANIDKARSTRVNSIAKNPGVRRFGYIVPTRKYAQASKVAMPTAKPAKNTKETSKAVVPSRVPSMVTSVSHHQLERLLDEALAKADAHKKALNGDVGKKGLLQRIRRAPRWLTVSAALLIVGLLGGLYAWHNVPQVGMRVASVRANVKAQVPSYTPSGFSFSGPVSYSSGKVHIKFKSNSDSNRSFTLTQEKSNMSNKSLADSVVPKETQVQTSQVAGTTVYIYGSNNDAAWVNNGVQYTIKDAANLNSDQLLKIAGSL